jgi:hypothetical protein
MIFMELPPKTALNSGHRFCEIKIEHKKRFIWLSRHFTVMLTVALLVAIVGITSLLPQATKVFRISPANCISLISECRLAFVKNVFETSNIICVHPVFCSLSMERT